MTHHRFRHHSVHQPTPIIHPKLRLLLIGSNLWYLGEGLFGPLFAVFTERVGGDILEITWAWAAYLIVTGIAMIIVGKVSDKMVAKEKLMVAGYALNALVTFSYLFVRTPVDLLLVQVGLGIAAALATPTWSSLYARYENPHASGYEWGLADGQSSIVTGIAVVIGGLIVTFYSFELLFILMGVIQVIATIYQAQILREN